MMPGEDSGQSGPKKLAQIVAEKAGVLSTSDTVEQAGDKMRALGVDSLPVSEGRRLVGAVNERHPDRTAAGHGHDPSTTLVVEGMSRDVAYCFEDQERADAERIMDERGVDSLPVVDRELRIVGMITRRDLAASGATDFPTTPLP
ncbi:MAG TPA: CBS domain-containing protein [Chthoniobacteraceae bacterium]|jgi:CBS domain-containing protein|nr:CBS domain-containing protein [Chthoniobacteraceae bacterium]